MKQNRVVYYVAAVVACFTSFNSGAASYYSGTGHYYEYVAVTGGITWTNALAAAGARKFQGLKGHLATIGSDGENAFILGLGIPGGGAWLGGIQSPPDTPVATANWTWITGEPWQYTHWEPTEPNDYQNAEYQLAFDGQANGSLAGYWNDAPGGLLYEGYIVEYEPAFLASTGHYYEYIPVAGGITWSNALAAAAARSYNQAQGHLATITSLEENNFVQALDTPGDVVWIGGVQVPWYTSSPAANWTWITGEPWGFTNWESGEPNDFGGYPEFELAFYGTDGRWNDLPGGDAALGYVVEYEPTGSVQAQISVSQVRICWNSVAGIHYQVQYRSTLTGNQWLNLGNVVTGDGGTDCVTDDVTTTARFYQVIIVP